MLKFKSNESCICPFCEEPSLDFGAVVLEGNMCYFPWKCLNCKHEGEEWYNLKFVGHNVIDKNGEWLEIEDYMIEREEN